MSMSKQPTNSFLVDKTKKVVQDFIRVKEEIVVKPVTVVNVAALAKLKIPASAAPKKRKNAVSSPISSECSTTSSSSGATKKRKASSDMFDMNDMGSAEEKIKEMERQLLSLDPDSKEAKKKRRLIRNRMSAQLHRERKKAYVVQLEEQLQAKEDEMEAMRAQLEALKAENLRMKGAEVTAIKTEEVVKPVEVMAVEASFDADSLIYDLDCEPEHWDSSILNDLDAVDLLPDDFPEPPPMARQPSKEVHDSFAAKKNLAMMMAIVFSMTFFGGMVSLFDTFSSGSSSGFCSYFKSYSPKLLSEMNVKSRILSDLEGTTWMDFPEMNDEPAKEKDSSSDHNQYSHAVPDDLFDDISMSFAMPLDDEEEEEEEESTASEHDATSEEEDSGSDSNFVKTKSSKLPLTGKDLNYANLARLWCEKRHVLCTLSSAGEELKRAVVDLSHVNDTVAMELSFNEVLASFTTGDEDPKILGSTEKQVLSFLYPMGVFSKDSVDVKVMEPLPFMEVACHI